MILTSDISPAFICASSLSMASLNDSSYKFQLCGAFLISPYYRSNNHIHSNHGARFLCILNCQARFFRGCFQFVSTPLRQACVSLIFIPTVSFISHYSQSTSVTPLHQSFDLEPKDTW
ncbi:hypothetical protein CW304_26315 [Bacillus sp. UFRGS-B20]|nr:hypothetical protein CW304_26315 [Bacillus sp. UFRGS-B20]